MPIKYSIYTPAVLTLQEKGACASIEVDPRWFDLDRWSTQAEAVVTFYCRQCPVMDRCAEVVMGPAKHGGYSGIAGGRVWRNGRPVRRPTGTRPRKLSDMRGSDDVLAGAVS